MIDELDKRIIRLLQKNARVPNTEIARSLNVTETTIRNRVSRLLDEGLINIIAVLDPKATEATISAFLRLTVTPAEVELVAASLHGRTEVRYLARVLSPSQLLVEAFFRDHAHILEFESGYLASLPAVQKIDTTIVLNVHKLSYEWEI